MTDTREATPRGWKYVPQHIAEGPSEVRHPDGWLICTTPSDELAALIVRAVNHFDEVVEVLRWYASAEAWTARETEGPDGDYGKRARAILSKLEASHGSA